MYPAINPALHCSDHQGLCNLGLLPWKFSASGAYTDRHDLVTFHGCGKLVWDGMLDRHLVIIIKREIAADGVVVQPRGGARPNRVRVNDNIKECALRVVEQHIEFTLA